MFLPPRLSHTQSQHRTASIPIRLRLHGAVRVGRTLMNCIAARQQILRIVAPRSHRNSIDHMMMVEGIPGLSITTGYGHATGLWMQQLEFV